MSSGEARRVSRQDIQLVQNLIERCLQLYMNKQEVVNCLLARAKIEPDFTELVWQKLEEENHEFFKAYHVRLSVKEQIEVFNKLLEQQVKLMPKMLPAGVASMPVSNGSHMPQLQQSSACYVPEHTGPEMKPDNMHQPIGSSLPNGFTNGGSALHTHMHTGVNMSAHGRRMDAPPNMLQSQSSDMRIIQGMNGGMIKSEPGYSGDIPYIYGNDGNALELRPAIGGASFNNVDPNSQALHEPQTLLDGDISPFGLLGTIPRNFSLSDLASDFSQSSDILESYSRSPFLPTDTDFLDSRERGENQGDSKRLDTISEYKNFGCG